MRAHWRAPGGDSGPGGGARTMEGLAPLNEAPMKKPLTALEDATFRFVLSILAEADGWVDLTRVCSRTGRHLSDVRQAVARLVRRRLILLDTKAPNTERWLRFVVPGSETSRAPAPDAGAPVA